MVTAPIGSGFNLMLIPKQSSLTVLRVVG